MIKTRFDEVNTKELRTALKIINIMDNTGDSSLTVFGAKRLLEKVIDAREHIVDTSTVALHRIRLYGTWNEKLLATALLELQGWKSS